MSRNPLKIALDWWHIKRDPVGYARKIGVQVGNDCRFLNTHSKTFGSEPYLIRIGNHVTVTSGVRFINHDGGMWIFREQEPDIELFGTIVVEDNVFIGMNSLILPNVRIGRNSVIGAGSLVARDIPPNSIAVGIPAKRIKSSEEYRESINDRVLFTRALPPDEKRAALTERFWHQAGETEGRQ